MTTEHNHPVNAVFSRIFDLTPEEHTALAHLSENSINIKSRTKLLDEGKKIKQMFILKVGWVIEYKDLKNGKRQILNFRLPGDIIGLQCMGFPKAPFSSATLTDCEISPLASTSLEKLQRELPRLGSALFLITLRDAAILHEWEVNLGRRMAYPRIAHLLLETDKRVRLRGLANDDGIPFPLTQQDITDCTGLTLSYVNRILARMRSDELIRVSGDRLEICRPEDLAKKAGFDASYLEHFERSYPIPLEL